MSADFNINDHLRQMNFGAQSSTNGDGGEATSGEGLVQKGIDKTVQNFTKVAGGALGIHINTDIEGKSALAGFDLQAVAGSMSLANAALFKAESGGGFLSMIWDKLKQYFTRDLPSAVAAPVDSGSGGGGGFADGGGASDGGGAAAAMAGGGADFGGPAGLGGGGAEMPDVQVSYGGKMVSSDALVADLGNLRPDATPSARGGGMGLDTGGGMAV